MSNIIDEIKKKINRPTQRLLLDMFIRNARIKNATGSMSTRRLLLQDYPNKRTLVLNDETKTPIAVRTRKKLVYVCQSLGNENFNRSKEKLVKKLGETLLDFEYIPPSHILRIIQEIRA